MRKTMVALAAVCVVGGSTLLTAGGCGQIRFAPGEVQKQNAWVHNRTAAIAAQTAQSEQSSEKLQELTNLSEVQSRAFVAYCGLPQEFPKAENAEDVLAESSRALTRSAIAESSQRPDVWQVADSAIELGIGVAGLLGGVYGTSAVRFLRQAKAKSNAIREIVLGNELFKKTNNQLADAFKQAHRNQSALTREIVTQVKGSVYRLMYNIKRMADSVTK